MSVCEITSFCWLHPTVSLTLTLTQCDTVNSASRTKSVRRTKRICEMSLLSFGFCRKKRGAEDVPGGDAQDDTINISESTPDCHSYGSTIGLHGCFSASNY